jgi:hypothetical protein
MDISVPISIKALRIAIQARYQHMPCLNFRTNHKAGVIIMKSTIMVTVGGGVVQGVWVSKDIKDTVQVIVKGYDCQQDEDQPNTNCL